MVLRLGFRIDLAVSVFLVPFVVGREAMLGLYFCRREVLAANPPVVKISALL